MIVLPHPEETKEFGARRDALAWAGAGGRVEVRYTFDKASMTQVETFMATRPLVFIEPTTVVPRT